MALPFPLNVVAHTRGNQTKYGAVWLAVIGKAASNPPRYVSNAIIDKDGFVVAGYQGKSGAADFVAIDTIENFIDEFRRIADECKLADDERVYMFQEIRKWISEDNRAVALANQL